MGSENVMSIPLPPKYALLERFFNAVESSLYCQKKNSVEFETLRAAVEANVRKTFTEEQFGKLMTIYPEAYDLSRGAKDNAILVSLPPRNYTGDLGAAQHCLNRRRTFKEKLVQLLLVTDKIMPSPMPADTRDSTAADRAMHTKATEGSSGGPGLDLAAVKALKECRRDAPATSKRKFSYGQDSVEDSSVPSAKENKRRNMPAGLKGLPMSLIDSIRTRKEKEQLMDPKVQAERQRARMIETLPAMFDMVYFHFKSIKKHKSEVDKLAQTLAQTEGNVAGWNSEAQYKDRMGMIKEQLQLLVQRIPEFCQLSESKVKPGSKLFAVKLQGVDISQARSKLSKHSQMCT